MNTLQRQIQASLLVILSSLTLAAGATEAQQITSVRQIDFKNFTYAWTKPASDVPGTWRWLSSTPSLSFRAVHGLHHFYGPGQDPDERARAPLISVDSVEYGDLDGDGVEEALVALNYSNGGTANWDYLYVYKFRDGQATLLARLETGSRAFGGLLKYFAHDGALTMEFADAEKREGDCCSRGYVRVHYRWGKGHFEEEGVREHGDLKVE